MPPHLHAHARLQREQKALADVVRKFEKHWTPAHTTFTSNGGIDAIGTRGFVSEFHAALPQFPDDEAMTWMSALA